MKIDILTMIKSANNAKAVKIRVKPPKGGKRYLYLDYYHNGRRERIYPGVFITMDPQDRKRDELAVRRITLLRDQHEARALNTGELSSLNVSLSLPDYAGAIIATKNPKTAFSYKNGLAAFLKLYPNIKITEIDRHKASAFQRSISRLTPCTINHYIQAMGHFCIHAVRDGLLPNNPFDSMRVRVRRQIKEFLTLEEIISLMETPSQNEAVKRAFLFSCFTGLRFGDIENLRHEQIIDGYLVFTQSKTGSDERLLLPEPALDLVGTGEGRLFHLPPYKRMRKELNEWLKVAGITKHVTFHCARHTFATLQLTLGTDIYTVSKLLGHSDVRVTQIYAKLVDQKKDDAMSRISKAIKSPPGG